MRKQQKQERKQACSLGSVKAEFAFFLNPSIPLCLLDWNTLLAPPSSEAEGEGLRLPDTFTS